MSGEAKSDGAPPALELEGVWLRYDDGTEALRRVSLRVPVGARIGLVGPNGAGKSSLLLLLNGILRPSEGRVRVAGAELRALGLQEVRRRVGLLFQDPDDMLFTTRVGEDVAFGPRHLGLSEDEVARRTRAALSQVGMAGAEAKVPFKLSRGQKQRVALASVLAMEPEVLVLDEPSASLDPQGRRQLIALVQGLGCTLLVASHDLELVLALCEVVFVLDRGEVVAEGEARTVLADGPLMERHGLEVPWSLRDRRLPPVA